jgi:nucleoside-diphosphate-sugar epimerase
MMIGEAELRQKLTGQRVMLIGGAGFIGHNLALGLRPLGAEVMVVDNLSLNNVVDNLYAQREPVQREAYQQFLMSRYTMMRDLGVQMRNGDARNFQDLLQRFEEFHPTKVVHLSAIASAVDARNQPGLCFDLQLSTLRNTLEIVRARTDVCRQVMLLSSSTVYGDFENESVDETVRPRPRGIYANAKYMAERLMRTYADQYGVGMTIVRPSALYGERCISRRVSQVFIENALTGKVLRLEGGGSGRLDFTYIRDLVDGMCRCLALYTGPEFPTTFNLTFGNSRSILELASIVKSVVPEAILEDHPRNDLAPIRGTLSMDRAHKVLEFYPQWPLEVGYKAYCEWYAETWRQAQARVKKAA